MAPRKSRELVDPSDDHTFWEVDGDVDDSEVLFVERHGRHGGIDLCRQYWSSSLLQNFVLNDVAVRNSYYIELVGPYEKMDPKDVDNWVWMCNIVRLAPGRDSAGNMRFCLRRTTEFVKFGYILAHHIVALGLYLKVVDRMKPSHGGRVDQITLGQDQLHSAAKFDHDVIYRRGWKYVLSKPHGIRVKAEPVDLKPIVATPYVLNRPRRSSAGQRTLYNLAEVEARERLALADRKLAVKREPLSSRWSETSATAHRGDGDSQMAPHDMDLTLVEFGDDVKPTLGLAPLAPLRRHSEPSRSSYTNREDSQEEIGKASVVARRSVGRPRKGKLVDLTAVEAENRSTPKTAVVKRKARSPAGRETPTAVHVGGKRAADDDISLTDNDVTRSVVVEQFGHNVKPMLGLASPPRRSNARRSSYKDREEQMEKKPVVAPAGRSVSRPRKAKLVALTAVEAVNRTTPKLAVVKQEALSPIGSVVSMAACAAGSQVASDDVTRSVAVEQFEVDENPVVVTRVSPRNSAAVSPHPNNRTGEIKEKAAKKSMMDRKPAITPSVSTAVPQETPLAREKRPVARAKKRNSTVAELQEIKENEKPMTPTIDSDRKPLIVPPPLVVSTAVPTRSLNNSCGLVLLTNRANSKGVHLNNLPELSAPVTYQGSNPPTGSHISAAEFHLLRGPKYDENTRPVRYSHFGEEDVQSVRDSTTKLIGDLFENDQNEDSAKNFKQPMARPAKVVIAPESEESAHEDKDQQK